MTAPGVGGSDLGTAYGKVRIDYESSGVAKATKDVEALQTSLIQTGKEFDAAGKGALTAVASINKFAAQSKSVSGKNPAKGMANQVESELGRATASMASFQKKLEKTLATTITSKIIIKPLPEFDYGNFSDGFGVLKKKIEDGLSKQQAIAPKVVVRPLPEIDWENLGRVASTVKKKVESGFSDPITAKVIIKPIGNLDDTALNMAVSSWKRQIENQLGSISATITPTIRAGQLSDSASGGKASAGLLGGLAGGGLLKLSAKAGVIGSAIGGIGYALTKGFSRLEGLDHAAVKLKALGLETAQIKEVSESALKAVKGTAFGLDAAFNTAANAINSGIKPGKQLNKYLEATSNTAALAGVSMEELGQTFGQAATQGKLTGDILQLLYSRNVPVLKLLAEQYGVTEAKARDMVTNSEVDFNGFIDAMSKTGGAAKLMGNTISGSFANLKSAVSRVGAALLAPLFGEASGEASTFAKAIQWATDVLGKFETFLGSHKKGMIDFWAWIARGALASGKIILDVVSFITDAIVKVTEVIGDLTGWISRGVAKAAKVVGASGIADELNEFADAAHNLGTGLRQNRDDRLGKMFTALNKGWSAVDGWADASKRASDGTDGLGSSAEDASKKTISLKDALETLATKGEAAETALKGTNSQFKEFIKSLKEKKAPQDVLDLLQKIRDQYEHGGRQIESYANAIDKLGDSTASASDKADSLISSLQGLGLLPGGDALESYNKTFAEMTSYQSQIIDLADTTGDALANLDGTINLNSKNGQNLYDQIKQIRREAVGLMTSGEASPDEAYARTVQGLQQLLIEQANISPDVAQKVIDSYFPKDAILNSIKASGDPKKAIQDLFKNDPAKLNSELNLLTTTQDILGQIVGSDGQLHVPTVLDVNTGDDSPTPTVGVPSAPEGKQLRSGATPFIGPVSPGSPDGYVRGPDGKIYKESDLQSSTTSSVLPPSAQSSNPNVLQPNGLPGLLGDSGANGDALGQLANSKEALEKAFAENPDIANVLNDLVSQANSQGQNMGQAFADGILMGTDEVRKALLQLAQLAPDILGNSPAKYGPLSGKGWTFFRGQKFTSAFADGVMDQASTLQNSVMSTANSAATGLVEPFDDRLARTIKDLQEFSDFGKHVLNLGKQIGNIVFGTLNLANTLSGGSLFPKSYVKDNTIDTRRGSALGGWNPQGSVWKANGTSGKPSAPTGLANNGQQGIADYITQKALASGYSQDQANAFVVQAFGESGLRSNAFGATTGDKSGGASGIFQFTPDTWKDFGQGGNVLDAQANIDAYFRLAQARDPGSGDIKSRLAKISGGGPADTSNAGHWDKALAGAAPFLSNVLGNASDNNNWGLANTTYGVDPSKDIRQGKAGFPSWVYALADQFGLEASTYAGHQTTGENGQINSGPVLPNPKGLNRGIDWWPKGNAQMYPGKTGYSAEEAGRLQAFADYLSKSGLAEQVIFQNPRTGDKTGFPFNSDYSADYPEHGGHVHTRHGRDLEMGGDLPGTMPGLPMPVTLPQFDSNNLANVAKNTGYSMPAELQKLVDGNPLLQQAVRAQGAGAGLTSSEVVPLLQNIDSEIAKQNAIGTPQSKGLSDALGTMKGNLQGQYGLKEGPTGLSVAQDITGGISSIASDVFGIFDQAFKVIDATKSIGDTAVRGVSNTEDVMNIIDNVQEYITMVQQVAQTVSDVSDLVGKFAEIGAAGSGAPGAGGPQAVTSAISGISSMVAQVAAAINTVIDVGQEAYRITTKYWGRFITSWLGMPGAKDMNFLLDTMSGQLKAYTTENPDSKTTLNTWAREMGSSKFQERPSPTNILTIYQGPGQDPRDTMNDAMFAVRASGVGVFGYDD